MRECESEEKQASCAPDVTRGKVSEYNTVSRRQGKSDTCE